MRHVVRAMGWCWMLACGAASAQEVDFVGQLREGGTGILVIGALSLLMVTVALERFVNFRQSRVAKIKDGGKDGEG